MPPKFLKYIVELECVSDEIEWIKQKTQNEFNLFVAYVILQCAIERDIETIGAVIRKIPKIKPTIKISSSKKHYTFEQYYCQIL